MNQLGRWGVLGIIFFLTISPIHAATTATTLFTFNVPVTRSISIAYGASCTSNAFFFNEASALFDPDVDGNGARVRPSSERNTSPSHDINFENIGEPSTAQAAYAGGGVTPLSVNNSPATEFTDTQYVDIESINASYVFTLVTTSGQSPTHRFVFPIAAPETEVTDINFFFYGQHQSQTCSAGAPNGLDRDFNMLIWNFDSGAYERIAEFTDGTNLGGGTVNPHPLAGIKSGNIAPYIGGGQLIFAINGRTSNGNNQCLYTDFAELRYGTGGPYCQSSTLAPFTLTNTGNVDINVDGNFASVFAGVDINLVLKTWMGTGTGCGTDGNGLGGWQKDCTITGITSPVTQTACKNYNSSNATIASRLITNLVQGDTNQLCFSGDFNGFVQAGDHNEVFQTGGDFS